MLGNLLKIQAWTTTGKYVFLPAKEVIRTKSNEKISERFNYAS
jgi:hypothetical protein